MGKTCPSQFYSKLAEITDLISEQCSLRANLFSRRVDNLVMYVGAVSFSNSLASQATQMQASAIQQQLSVAVLKNTLDNQKQQGNALVEMIRQTPSVSGTGSLIDVRA
jgi:hypothetical protein